MEIKLKSEYSVEIKLIWAVSLLLLLCRFGLAAEIFQPGLIDHFDPDQGVTTNSAGNTTGWINQAAEARSVTNGSTAATLTEGPNGQMLRFDAPANTGHLSYASPGAETLKSGYTLFLVFRLQEELGSGNIYPRLWRGANDEHALFFRRENGRVEVKSNPLPGNMRPSHLFSASYESGMLAILTARMTSNSQALYFNGELVDASQWFITDYTIDANSFQIGNSVKGDVGDVLVYDATVTLEGLNQTGAALADEYGVSWQEVVPLPPPPPVQPPLPPLRRIVAHRGNSSSAPENTLASIDAAAGSAAMTEFDIGLAADGVLVAMHDSSVDRTTDGTGSLAAMDYDGGIDKLDAGSWFSSDFAGERVPTMAESVQRALELGLLPQIERKSGSAQDYYRELTELGVLNRVHVIAFDWSFLSDLRALAPNLALGALGSGPITEATIYRIRNSGANYVSWSQSELTSQEVDLVHSNGLRMATWTANSTLRMRQLLDMGVDAISTDYPELLFSLVQSGNISQLFLRLYAWQILQD